FYWNELMTHDIEKAKKFYEDALGWSFEGMPMENGTYWLVKSGDRPLGGMFEMAGTEFDGMPEHWMAYISVDDIDARLEKAVAGGATITRPAFDVPGVGRIAMLQEPGGAHIGWMTPAEQ
ncbi:MAG: VOC family protein, partial [Pseudomonadota bacterium]